VNVLADLFATMRFIARHPLNARRKLAALGGFLRWQLGMRMLKKRVIVPWVDGSRFVTGLGETGLTGNLYAGFMEYEDMLFLLHALQPDETFVDVGANVGAYSILASGVVGAKSIAFEPLPGTAERLRDQVQVNRLESIVDIRNMGIGDAQGALYFTDNRDTVNRVSVAGDVPGTTRVSVGTLDAELADDHRYFMKVDVEGFEYNVIEGASRLLATDDVSAIIIELNGSGEAFGHRNEDVHDRLAGFGFIPVAYDPRTRVLARRSSYNTDGGNTIYVKNVERIAERCRSAPKRVVHTAGGISI